MCRITTISSNKKLKYMQIKCLYFRLKVGESSDIVNTV